MSTLAPLTPAAERRLLYILAAVQFTHVMDFMIMMPLGAGLMREFSINPGQFSRLVASYGLAAALTGFLGGFVLDRFDRKRALLWLYTGFGLSTLACAFAPTYGFLLAARLCAGAFGGVAGSVVTAMVGDVVPPERRGRGMATVMSAFPLASVLGVPTGLWLAHLFKWHAPFFLLGTLSGIILLVAWRILPHVHSHRSTEHPVRQMVAMLSLPVHQRCLLLSVALVFAGGSLIPFMAPSMVLNVGLSESQLPLIYFFGGACTFFTMPWVGRLADRHEKLHVLGWLTLCSALMALVITNLPVTPLPLVLTATSLFFISMTGRFAPAMAMITNAVEARYRGGFMSVNSAVQQAAAGLANLTAGALMTQNAAGRLIGYPRAGLVALVFFVLTFLLALRLRRLAPHASQPGGRQLTTPPMPVD